MDISHHRPCKGQLPEWKSNSFNRGMSTNLPLIYFYNTFKSNNPTWAFFGTQSVPAQTTQPYGTVATYVIGSTVMFVNLAY